MSIDYGTKVIGTAFYCPGLDPFPYIGEKIIYKSDQDALLNLKKIIENEGIDMVILGVPYFLDGKESNNTQKIKAFGKDFQTSCPHLLYFEQDETLTTKEAIDRMKNSPQYNFKVDPTKIDCLSAMIILEDFIRTT